jgi:hypothetical protein
MLDLSKPITVPILSGTEKRVKVTYPSDAQWCERARKQRVVRHFLGRGKSQTDDDSQADQINADLLAKIRLDSDGGIVLTSAEATMVLGKLERARVSGVDREGDTYRIALKTALGEVTHIVGIPSAEQMLVHERQSTKTTEGRRNQEIRGYLEPSGELYDKVEVAKSREGYVDGGAVPIVHKVAVIAELLAQINAEDEDLIPEA